MLLLSALDSILCFFVVICICICMAWRSGAGPDMGLGREVYHCLESRNNDVMNGLHVIDLQVGCI
jgi:hypothetical protein